MSIMNHKDKGVCKGVCTCSCSGCNNGQHCGISRDGCGK
jgi:hypothetical protein